MLYTIPDYYREFHCVAGACEDTCCAGWQIEADARSLARYRREQGAFRRKLRRSVNWKDGTFRQTEEKRCAFLNQENLCEIYLALGKESLCKTCRMYPRHVEEFENVRELTLSVSCPEVARILLGRKEIVKFLLREDDREEEYEEFDSFLYSCLNTGRECMQEILQNRENPIAVRAGLMLAVAHDMQIRIRKGEIFSCDEVFDRYRTGQAELFVRKQLEMLEKNGKEMFEFIKKMFRNQYGMEVLREDWRPRLLEADRLLYDHPAGHARMRRRFDEWLRERMPESEIWYEQLLVYFISTYFCGAVYDGQAYAKAQMAAVSVLLIHELLMAEWLRNEETLTFEDVAETVYRYSRELEHSDLNLELMERQMRRNVMPWFRK